MDLLLFILETYISHLSCSKLAPTVHCFSPFFFFLLLSLKCNNIIFAKYIYLKRNAKASIWESSIVIFFLTFFSCWRSRHSFISLRPFPVEICCKDLEEINVVSAPTSRRVAALEFLRKVGRFLWVYWTWRGPSLLWTHWMWEALHGYFWFEISIRVLD